MSMISSITKAQAVFQRFPQVTERFFHVFLAYLDFILLDQAFYQAARQQQALSDLYPNLTATRYFQDLSCRVLMNPERLYPYSSRQRFWYRLLTSHAQPVSEMLQPMCDESKRGGPQGVMQ